MWPIILGLCSGWFGGTFRRFPFSIVSNATTVLTLISFLRRQAQFSQFLSTNSSITTSRYFRLIALACTEAMFTTPLAIFSLVINATSAPMEPWISWENTHYNFGRVGQVPAVLWRSDPLIVAGLTLTKWSCVICAFVFFIFFGFASEARRNYSSALTKLFLTCGLKKPATTINEKSRYANDCPLVVFSLIARQA